MKIAHDAQANDHDGFTKLNIGLFDTVYSTGQRLGQCRRIEI